MAIQIRDLNNIMRAPPVMKVRATGGVVRTIVEGRIRDAGNVSRLFLGAMTGVVTPATYSESKPFGSYDFSFQTAIEMQMTVTNGVPPISYYWHRVSGATVDHLNGVYQLQQKTRFIGIWHEREDPETGHIDPHPGSHTAIWACQATDALGRVCSANINITLSVTG